MPLDIAALIIEDEQIFARLLEHELRKKVSKVFCAHNVEAGQKILEENIPDVIFLDNFLPGQDGIDSLSSLKKNYPHSKFVLMSSVLNVSAVTEALQNGADFLLNKKNDLKEALDPILSACSSRDKALLKGSYSEKFTFKESNHELKRIAILEDEELFSLHLNWILNSLSTKTKITAFTKVQEFIEALIQKEHFDFVLSDYYLPDGNVSDAISFIHNENPSTKVIVFSSKANVDKIIELKNMGVDGFIEKSDNWKVHFLNTLRNMDLF